MVTVSIKNAFSFIHQFVSENIGQSVHVEIPEGNKVYSDSYDIAWTSDAITDEYNEQSKTGFSVDVLKAGDVEFEIEEIATFPLVSASALFHLGTVAKNGNLLEVGYTADIEKKQADELLKVLGLKMTAVKVSVPGQVGKEPFDSPETAAKYAGFVSKSKRDYATVAAEFRKLFDEMNEIVTQNSKHRVHIYISTGAKRKK